jgi:hypothetical protein
VKRYLETGGAAQPVSLVGIVAHGRKEAILQPKGELRAVINFLLFPPVSRNPSS